MVTRTKEKPRLKKTYQEKIIPEMVKECGFKNSMQVPKVEKIIINVGMGDASREQKLLENAINEIGDIAGQKPVITRSKKSIAAFKIREKVPVGIKVTLRGDKMYEFLDRFLSISIPRMRDFRGLSRKSFDRFGNYSVGIKEQLIFPEIDYDKVLKISGMDITFVTNAGNKDDAEVLFEKLGFPFKEKK